MATHRRPPPLPHGVAFRKPGGHHRDSGYGKTPSPDCADRSTRDRLIARYFLHHILVGAPKPTSAVPLSVPRRRGWRPLMPRDREGRGGLVGGHQDQHVIAKRFCDRRRPTGAFRKRQSAFDDLYHGDLRGREDADGRSPCARSSADIEPAARRGSIPQRAGRRDA